MSLSILKQLIAKQSSPQRYSGELCNLNHFLFGKLAMSLRSKRRKAYLTLLLTSLLLSVDGSGIKNNHQVAIAQTNLPSNSCPAIPGGIPPEPDAISWTDGNYSLYTIGNNSNSQGSQESGFAQAVANRGGTLTTLNSSNDFSFTGNTGPGSAAASVGTFSNGTLSFSTNYTTTNRAEFRTTTFDAFVSGSSGDSVYIFPEQGGSAGDFYTVSIDFTNPVEAFSFDLVDIFDTLPDNNPVIRYEVYADGQLIAYFRGPFLGDDQVGNTDLFDGAGTLRGSVPTGQNLENTIGFLTDVPVSNVSIRHVIESGTILSTARDPHGFDYFSYSISLPECVPDRSDAPVSYGSPAHVIVSGTQLGPIGPDEDAADQPTTTANGDDNDGTDDEDGVLLGGSDLQGQSLTAGSSVTLDLTTQGSGVLNAWFDWNGNGNFDDTGERVATNVVPSGGAIALNVTVPAGATVGNTYARFRYSSDTDLAPTGTASDGEVEDYQVAISPSDQFACPRAFYQIINNQLRKLDPLTGQYLDVGSPVVAHYNAAGYNPADNYIYGYGRGGSINNRLVQIAQDGTLTNLGAPTKVGGVGTLSDAHSGDFDDSGNLWLRSTLSGARIFRLNVTTNEYVGFALSQNLPEAENVADWVYINGKLYGGFGRTLYIIDLSNQTLGTTLSVTTVSVPDLPAGAIFGAGYTDINNNLYLSDNAGALYQVLDYDTPTPTAIKLVNTTSTSFNDGMGCPDAPPPFDFDFGDAPDTTAGNGTDNYSTLLSDSGPFHLIDANLYLGGGVTADTDGFGDGIDSNSNASDDTDDAFGSLANIPATGTYDLTNIPVHNTNSSSATLHAWIDFDKNGQFAVSEYQSVSVPQGTPTVDLSWSIPGGTTDGTTYARFRLTTDSNLTDVTGTAAVDERSIGSASGGEVEDYQVAIQPISTNPNVVLVERITAINGNRTQNPNDNTLLNTVVNDSVANSADDQSHWPASYLVGAIDGGLLQPGDKIERTVYFLNTGINNAASVRICDWIQPYESFLTGVYGGNDIELVIGGATYQLTAISDAADRAELSTVGSLSAGPTCNLPAAATNSADEVLVLDITGTTGDPTGLATLPGTTGQGTPTNAYGYFRFTTKVDE